MKAIYYKKGNKVKIYQRPVTREKYEGEATLIEFQGKHDYAPYMETWLVRFDNESEQYSRTIMPPEEVTPVAKA